MKTKELKEWFMRLVLLVMLTALLFPKLEGVEGNPLSPHAVTNWVNQLYGNVSSKVYGFHSIGLRYFNVFRPRQNPDNTYAAVISLFMKAAISKHPILWRPRNIARFYFC